MKAFITALAATAAIVAGVALSGTVMAANVADRSLAGDDLTPVPPAPDDVYTAAVEDNGKLKRGVGADKAKRLGKGEYEVLFTADVNNCVWVASIGLTGTGDPFPGIVSTALRKGNNKGVYVLTANQNAVLKDLAFSIIVTCP